MKKISENLLLAFLIMTFFIVIILISFYTGYMNGYNKMQIDTINRILENKEISNDK